jgi:hypothetical protein
MDLECKYRLENNTCELANKIAGIGVIPHESACSFCINKAKPPQELNSVVISITINAIKNDKKKLQEIINDYGYLIKKDDQPSNNERLKNILNGSGVGSQMWRLLQKIGIKHTSSCPCLSWAEMMNSWGIEGCRLYKKDIINHMKSSAKSYGWGNITKAVGKSISSGLAFRLSITNPFGSLLDEAIRLAEEAENKIPLPDMALMTRRTPKTSPTTN